MTRVMSKLDLSRLSAPPLRYLALPLLIVSAIGVVGMKHHSRALQTEAQALAAEREQLEVEFNQLRLERGYVGAHSRVGELAEKQLGMKVPDDYVIVQVPGQE
ncbi:cell division protein FtsL [Oceanococcus atlanticus]|uniref:Cell division protein FtsL n=1 Tax=Oceanococcus atlanticus TaxID=1317117 RepID=A0A1Y1SHX0_9GAMM|nr:cell division protein FtsL [Oceanococcus atlanticus]ORE89246.1 cell division protein FtsL [Oceanococcus atlanticus]RZO85075.1 MAG: cell division protein FtsL [Oceanococcus sp.]